MAYGARPVRAQTVPPAAPCDQISGIGGSIVTCSGNLSTGVNLCQRRRPLSKAERPRSDGQHRAGVRHLRHSIHQQRQRGAECRYRPVQHRATDATAMPSRVFACRYYDPGGGSVTDQLDRRSSATPATMPSVLRAQRIWRRNNHLHRRHLDTGTFSAGINVGSIGTLGTTQGAITINSSGLITTTGISAIGINAASVYGRSRSTRPATLSCRVPLV